jgi:hypothetical protein
VRNKVSASRAGTRLGIVNGDLIPSIAATDSNRLVRSRLRLEAAISREEASERGE